MSPADQIAAAARAIRIAGAREFFCLGEHINLRSGRSATREDKPTDLYLMRGVQSALYRNFYCTGGRPAVAISPYTGEFSDNETFLARLRGTRSSEYRLFDGAVVQSHEPAGTCVALGNLKFLVTEEESSGIESAKIGETISVRVPCESLNLSPGYYFAHGWASTTLKPRGRIYFNADPNVMALLFQELVDTLNSSELPFDLKAVNHLDGFARTDTAVLYFELDDVNRILEVIAKDLPSDILERLRADVPAFTLRLSDGLSFAEDVGSGESFGLVICRGIAQGIVNAWRAGDHNDQDAQYRHVRTTLLESELDPDRPYLKRNSRSSRPLCPPALARRSLAGKKRRARRSVMEWIDVANAIGSALTKDAIWHEDRCNWLGIEPPDESAAGEPTSRRVVRTLGPDVYAGTAGVALFLMELSSVSGEQRFLKTAKGALRQAVHSVSEIPESSVTGLYTGMTGIAAVCARYNLMSRSDEFRRTSLDLSEHCRKSQPADSTSCDLLDGLSGTVMAMLHFAEVYGDESFRIRAIELGHRIVRSARVRRSGVSWENPSFPEGSYLVGFSHGAAGIALALHHLYLETGDPEFENCSHGAKHFEDASYDEANHGWPDFRFKRAAAPNARQHQVTSHWCHGAPGILMSRIGMIPSASNATTYARALDATKRNVRESIEAGCYNSCLCHGLYGNADILLNAAQSGSESNALQSLVEEAADYGARRFAANHSWPCGHATENHPSLFLGLAGIGLHYLRLCDTTLPSPLDPVGWLKLRRIKSPTTMRSAAHANA